MNEEKIPPILCATVIEANVEQVACDYVSEFNKLGAHTIIAWKVRNPTEKEMEYAEPHWTAPVNKVGEKYIADAPDGKKQLFVIETLKSIKTPENIMKMRQNSSKELIGELEKSLGEKHERET